jgi:ketosteroid isomerase-like protein
MSRTLRTLALLAVPTATFAQNPLRRQVDSLHAAMVAAFTATPASTAKFYSDDAAIVSAGMRVVGRSQVDNYWAQIASGGTWKLEVLDIGGESASPWVHGRSTLRNASGRESLTEYIGLLQRAPDGQLRFRVDAYAGLSGEAPASPADETAIRKLDSLWARMYATTDTATALQLYAEPLAFIGANGQAKTRSQEMEDIRPTAGLTMEYFRTTPTLLRTFQNVAIVSGTAEWRFSFNGPPRDVRRGYTAIYSRGGPLGWRIIAMQMR